MLVMLCSRSNRYERRRGGEARVDDASAWGVGKTNRRAREKSPLTYQAVDANFLKRLDFLYFIR